MNTVMKDEFGDEGWDCDTEADQMISGLFGDKCISRKRKQKKQKSDQIPSKRLVACGADEISNKKYRKKKKIEGHLLTVTHSSEKITNAGLKHSGLRTDKVYSLDKRLENSKTTKQLRKAQAINNSDRLCPVRQTVGEESDSPVRQAIGKKADSIQNAKSGGVVAVKSFSPEVTVDSLYQGGSSKFNKARLKDAMSLKSNITNGSKKTDLSKITPSSQPNPSKTITLKDKMEEKLKAARFRYLNEQLYTTTGSEALQLFSADQYSFEVYHEGFQSQVSKWPDNPLDKIIQYIVRRPSSEVIADFGCGDARLARSVKQKVHSFDLAAINSCVTVCDISKVPLESGCVDIAVFCLSLMGTNHVDYLLEANRVLRKGGTLLVAEVISRFDDVRKFITGMKKLGFQLLKENSSNKMFISFEFKKSAQCDPNKVPCINLQPCIYKKR